VVVHQAQLDIGFVRARTEVGIIELQPNHPRGHLSRYTALYTSLATRHDVEFDNLTAVAAPFPGSDTDPLRRGESRIWVTYNRHDTVRLDDVQVNSNSTQMVHSEQMFPLDGTIELGTSTTGHRRVLNGSQFHLAGVAVVRRPADGGDDLEASWVGPLRAGESAAIAFEPQPLAEDEVLFATQRKAEAAQSAAAPLDVDPLFQLACDAKNIAPGETRLVGRIDAMLPGQTVSPAASQSSGTTLVVAHLEYADRPPPRPDQNAAVDVVDEAFRGKFQFSEPEDD
jgi:hypothetical protein